MQPKPGKFKALWWTAVLLATRPLPALAQLTANDRAALADLEPAYAQHFDLHRGWFRGTPILYFDIGPQDNTTSAVYLFATGVDAGGTPHLVSGQRPVFSAIPGLEGFSAIWQVEYVIVGPGYQANTIRDARAAVRLVLSGEARVVIPGRFINYSIVPDGSTLVSDPDGRPLLKGWYRGAEVPYFDFGFTEREPAPIYPFVSGFDGDAPRFIRAQANVVDAVPGSDGGTHDLWDVTFVQVPDGYVPDTIRDLPSLLARQDFVIRKAGQVRNCPVVLVGGQRAPRVSLGG